LVAAEQTGQMADGELLERFASRREEEAFAALVRRHGALVLGVCRRVLHNRHDAEDAFQAAFLALARHAGSVGRRGSVGGWLHRVAYRAALKARARALKREEHERHARHRNATDPLVELTGRELLGLLDEELQRLPDEYREALVLCYLDGRTRDQAAQECGCSLSTMKRRLEQGRALLRARLSRRGISLLALLAAGVGGDTVSPALAAGTTRAALLVARGRVAALPAGVGFLMTQVVQSLSSGQRKSVGVALLALPLIAATTGLFAYLTSAAGTGTPQSAVEPLEPIAEARRSEPAPDDAKEMTVVGHVHDPEGRPLAGAQVAVLAGVQRLKRSISVSRERVVLGRGKTDGEGRFSLVVPRTSSVRNWGVDVLAGRAGHGLGWQSFDPDAELPDVNVRLTREQVIRGQLVDLQGQPAARVKLRLTPILRVQTREEAQGTELRMHKNVSLQNDHMDLHDLPDNLAIWPGAVTADEQGRFSIRGIGPGMSVELHVVDDRFGLQSILVPDTSKAQDAENVRRSLEPARVLEGRITYADSGKPAANVEVQGWGLESHGRTDTQGRFRINSRNEEMGLLIAYSPPGEPYCNVQKQFRWPKGVIKHTLDVALPRGVLVRGTVTDEATGRPVAGARVSYMAHFDNPNLTHEELSGNNFANGRDMVTTAADGTFRIACRPGPGHLDIEGPDPDYVWRRNVVRNTYGVDTWYSHGFVALDPKVGAEPVDTKVTLRKGVTIKGEVFGPGGGAVEDLDVFCRLQGFSTHPVKVHGNHFELHGCDPDEAITVMFFDAANHWGATARLSANKASDKAVQLRLAACGSARARFVDNEGKPLIDFYPGLSLVLAPKRGDTPALTYLIASPFRKVGPHTDKNGSCTFDTLIPGATYQFGYAEIQTTITAVAGKIVNLPDIVIAQP
jgi:RNA polymerase sigma factor (sigma-70 family)